MGRLLAPMTLIVVVPQTDAGGINETLQQGVTPHLATETRWR